MRAEIGRSLCLMVIAGAIAGCDAYISTSEHQARLQLADYGGWVRASAEDDEATVRQIGVVQVGRLAHGDETTIPLDVTGAHDATVIATCDRQCDDLDLRVVTEDGRLIDLDEEEDRFPLVKISAGKTNKLLVKIRMSHCASAACSFAVSQFQYDDPKGGGGTCFAVSPNGLLMTSLHVVDGAEKITVSFPDGRTSEAKVWRRSADNDLALLRTKLSTPEWLPFAQGSEISVGMPAFTVGFPSPDMLGSEAKFTEGNVSSLSGFDEEPTLLQVSVPIQPGNSGGPVVSHSGQVIGVIEASVREDEDGTRLQLTNFARKAQVASLVLPPGLASGKLAPTRTREQAVARTMKAVCKVDTE